MGWLLRRLSPRSVAVSLQEEHPVNEELTLPAAETHPLSRGVFTPESASARQS